MSKLYFADPTKKPQKIMAKLGVWTPEEYERELQKLALDDDEIAERMAAFRERHADCANYYQQMMELDLKRDVSDVHRAKTRVKQQRRSHRGGATGYSNVQDDDPHYRKNITGLDMLAKDENWENQIKGNYDENAQRAIRACRDDSVYNIDGKPLPYGKILEECINIYRAKDEKRQLYHRSLLEAAIECKSKGVSDADMATCVLTKVGELKAFLSIQSRVLQALGIELQKTESDMQTLAPGEKSDLKYLEKQNERAAKQGNADKQSWTRWAISQIKNSAVWVAGKSAELAMWVIRDPKTAKIVLFILKRMIKDACTYVYTNWLKNEKQYLGMFQSFWSQTKNFASSKYEFAKFAVTEGMQSYLKGNGFKNTWTKASSYLGVAVYGLVGGIPIVGSGIQAVGSIVNDILYESSQIYIETAIYEANVKFAGKTFIEILFVLMPVQVVENPQGGYSLQWNQSPESCVGILRQPQPSTGTAPLSEADTRKELEAEEFKSNQLKKLGNPLASMYNTTQAIGVDETEEHMVAPIAPNQPSGWFSWWGQGGGGGLPPQLPSTLHRP